MNLRQITCYFPSWLCEAVRSVERFSPEEIRLRTGQRPMAFYGGAEQELASRTVSAEELETIFLSAAKHSCYAAADKVCEGYLTLDGGHRIGICGTGVFRDGRLVNLKKISSLCFRIAADHSDRISLSGIDLSDSALIIGKPGSGKTTFLRAAIRQLSKRGQCIAVADTRGEIAACCDGIAQFPLGAHTDVLSGIGLSGSLLMLLRTMRPSWICCDEITAKEDIRAITLCSYCGTRLLATAHAQNREELYLRPLYRELMEQNIFKTLIRICEDRSIETERLI